MSAIRSPAVRSPAHDGREKQARQKKADLTVVVALFILDLFPLGSVLYRHGRLQSGQANVGHSINDLFFWPLKFPCSIQPLFSRLKSNRSLGGNTVPLTHPVPRKYSMNWRSG
jgi:hypothetical protein